MSRKKILFLYFELAGYFLACIDRLSEMYEVDVHIVKYPVNPVAPFDFIMNPDVSYYEYADHKGKLLIDLVYKINPDIVYICGWSNKDYLNAARSLNKKIPVILTFDNPWRGTFKQYVASLTGRFYLKSLFTHCWVPGEPNAIYARKLGFNGSHLLLGMYSADFNHFNNYYHEFREEKKRRFPHRFIFAGRYTALKGVRELWEAFIQLQKEHPSDWELWCLGKGELDPEFPQHEKIKNFGFVQPAQMHDYLKNTGVFILPAWYEHWGVVVHEFAAAGFPLICTDTTSAASAFLKNNYNGFTVPAHNVESIKAAMKKIINSTDEKLNEMSIRSVELAEKITPQTWAHTLMSIK